MDIFCACPFAVGTLAWEPPDGQKSLSVCVKATFVLAPGQSTIAAIQDPVRADGAAGDAPDLVPFKPRAEILFSGHAHAPGGGATDSLLARARIGAFRKALSINGDRTWVPSFDGLRPSAAVPFRRMPLVYDRAVRTGENLAGVDISQGAEPNRPLANIAAIADQGGETPGLAPIPFGWRSHRLGLGDRAILWAARSGLALGPPPPGFDFHIFNAAPFEQQIDEIPPGCDVLLENLHPQLAQLETRLPRVRVKLFQRSSDVDLVTEIPARCDTLWIDADRGLAIALWRGVAKAIDGGQLVVVAEPEAEPVRIDDVERLLARVSPNATYVDASLLGATPTRTPAIADPAPLAEGTLPTRTAPTTLAPPAAEERAAFDALPFRAGALGRPADEDDLEAESLSDADTPGATADDELTPPRGYPAPPVPLPGAHTGANGMNAASGAAAHGSAQLDDATYAAARLEAWAPSADLAAVLARRGIDATAFRAHEAATAEALAIEAAAGGSAKALAVLASLAAARGG